MIDKNKIRCDNSLDDIKRFDDYFFDIIYSDPPYNLASTWFIDVDGKYKLKKKQRDFFNKWNVLDENDLDTFFKEAFRTLKYGGYCILFGMDRQLRSFQYYAVKNGFEIHQSLYWFFMSNFPKASDVSKAIDKKLGKKRDVVGQLKNYKDTRSQKLYTDKENIRIDCDITAPSSDQAKLFEGYKYGKAALKQCLETIMIFHKPCKSKTIIDDIIECGGDLHPSVMNIDGERVEYVDDDDRKSTYRNPTPLSENQLIKLNTSKNGIVASNNQVGRHPSQLLVDDEAAKVIDEQTGIKKSSQLGKDCKTTGGWTSMNKNPGKSGLTRYYTDTGGGSKILHKCEYEEGEMDLLKYSPKVSKKERNEGVEGGSNHPCLKPMSLNKHILNLFYTSNNPRIYIPFSGVGSEIIPALQLGYDVYSSELNDEYYDIQLARIEHHTKKTIQIKTWDV